MRSRLWLWISPHDPAPNGETPFDLSLHIHTARLEVAGAAMRGRASHQYAGTQGRANTRTSRRTVGKDLRGGVTRSHKAARERRAQIGCGSGTESQDCART